MLNADLKRNATSEFSIQHSSSHAEREFEIPVDCLQVGYLGDVRCIWSPSHLTPQLIEFFLGPGRRDLDRSIVAILHPTREA